jgi:hypothetical protein
MTICRGHIYYYWKELLVHITCRQVHTHPSLQYVVNGNCCRTLHYGKCCDWATQELIKESRQTAALMTHKIGNFQVIVLFGDCICQNPLHPGCKLHKLIVSFKECIHWTPLHPWSKKPIVSFKNCIHQTLLHPCKHKQKTDCFVQRLHESKPMHPCKLKHRLIVSF